MKVDRATVLICTYNRAARVRETLAAVQAMEPPSGFTADIVVVDNNSSDDTRRVVEDAARRGPFPVMYLREERQGKSFALNLGLGHTTGDIVALTDDDVLPAGDWLNRIVAGFRAMDVTFVCGKVLPRWEGVPPPELLTRRGQGVWGPLAIADYGDEPVHYVAESKKQGLPIGANLAFARSALVAVGGWRTDLGRVNNTLISGEDHEIFGRLRVHGLYSGYYDPALTVRHHVPAERLTRRYFRRWFFWHGKTQALMLDSLYLDVDLSRVPSIAGVPRFVYRQLVRQVWRWMRRLGSRDALGLLIEELRLLQYLGMVTACWKRHAWRRTFASAARRSASFAGRS